MATTEIASTSVEELFEQFKQLPDWYLYPLPESFYKRFNIKKPQPATVMESVTYMPPPSVSLNKNGKVEVRPIAEGGVREIKDLMTLPVEVKMIADESTDQTAADTKPDSLEEKSTPPKEDSKKETLDELGLESSGLSDAFPYISSGLPYRL